MTNAALLYADQLLSEVRFKTATLREARKRFSSQLAPDFQIFDFLRDDEMGLSACLANLLNPRGSHGHGAVFLSLFLDQLANASAMFDCHEECVVHTEKLTDGNRRLDIYLEFRNGVIGIENKPWAGDQENQLRSYADYLKDRAGDGQWLLLYLSNDEPSAYSIDPAALHDLHSKGKYMRVSFVQIIDWLEVCAAASQAMVVQVFIRQLIKFIYARIIGIDDMSESKEIEELLLSSPEKLKAGLDIVNATVQLKKALLDRFISQLRVRAQAEGWMVVYKEKSLHADASTWAGFGVQFQRDDTLHLHFEFNRPRLTGFYWGIRRLSDAVPEETQLWADVNGAMTQKFGEGKRVAWWPWYSELPDRVLNSEQPGASALVDWRTSELPWVMLQSGAMVTHIIDLAKSVQPVLQHAVAPHRRGKALEGRGGANWDLLNCQ